MVKWYLTVVPVFLLMLACTHSKNSDMTNLEIIKSTYEGKSSEENGKNLAKYLAADVSWTEAKGFPYAGVYVGIEEISEHVFKRLGTEWEGYKFTPEAYVCEGDMVIAYGTYTGTYTGTYKKTNKSFSARVAHLWKLKDEKIIRFEQIVDSQPVNDVLK